MGSVGAIIDLRGQKGIYDLFLRKILGLEAITRMVLSLREIGIKNFYLILDDRYEKFEVFRKTLDNYSKRYEIEIFFHMWRDGEPQRDLIYQLEKSLPDKVIIFRGCFIFNRKALTSIKNALSNNDNVVILPNDAKKELDQKDFLPFFEKGFTILDGNRVEAYFIDAELGLGTIEIDDSTTVHIISKVDLKFAEKLLISDLSKPEDGFISYYINRKISTRISKLLVGTRISSNMITLISFSMMIIAAYLFSLGTFFNSIIAGVLTQFSSIIDGCDGELARLRYKPSPYGGLLDTTLDRYGDILVTIGIFYGYASTLPFLNTSTAWLLSFIPATGFILGSYVRKEYELKFQHKPKYSISLRLIRRDLRLFTIFLGALINHALEAALLIGSLTHIIIIWKFLIEPRHNEVEAK